MGILNIEQASRKGAHLLIQVFGGPRSGKTHTALKLARGIAGPNGKIGVLDTESGRARLYSDKIPGGFSVGELSPPYTPERYQAAIEEFIAFGADVLVVDSFSHIWAGPGGVLEAADAAERSGAKGLLKWLKPKVSYRKTVNFMLSTRMHIICCSRAKQPVKEQIVDGKKQYVTLPWEPIQDKTLKYEMTIVLPMLLDGVYETAPDRLKAPGDLLNLFTGKPIDESVGAAIAEWVGGARVIDHALELLRKQAADMAAEGSAAFTAWWNSAHVKPQRGKLRDQLDNLRSIAKAADDEAEEHKRNGATDNTNLDDPFGTLEQEQATVTDIRPATQTTEPQTQQYVQKEVPSSPLKNKKAEWNSWQSWALAEIRAMPQQDIAGFMDKHRDELDFIAENRQTAWSWFEQAIDDRRSGETETQKGAA